MQNTVSLQQTKNGNWQFSRIEGAIFFLLKNTSDSNFLYVDDLKCKISDLCQKCLCHLGQTMWLFLFSHDQPAWQYTNNTCKCSRHQGFRLGKTQVPILESAKLSKHRIARSPQQPYGVFVQCHSKSPKPNYYAVIFYLIVLNHPPNCFYKKNFQRNDHSLVMIPNLI